MLQRRPVIQASSKAIHQYLINRMSFLEREKEGGGKREIGLPVKAKTNVHHQYSMIQLFNMMMQK